MRTAWMTRSRGVVVAIAIPVVAIVLALLTTAIVLVIGGSDPIAAYRSMLDAALGSPFALSTTAQKAVPRLLAALGIALALRARLWNIGAEGQIYVGAIAATAITLWFPGLATLGIVFALIAAVAAGALWGAIPGVLRARRGISEVITSLMLVYVGIQLANYLVESPWSQPGATFPASAPVPMGERLPIIWPGTLLNAGSLIALASIGLTWLIVQRTTLGLRMRAVGGSPRASTFAGVGVGGTIVITMALSGAFAGLAGGIEVLGVRGRLIEGFSPGYGFEAIAIALIGQLNPIGILGGALLFGALDAGAAGLQTAAGDVPSSIVQVTEGLAVVYVLIGIGIHDIVTRRHQARQALKGHKTNPPPPAAVPEASTGAPS